MIRLLDDHVVADWGYYDWVCDDVPVRQVMVHLFNGMTLIMDEEEFWAVTDYEAS